MTKIPIKSLILHVGSLLILLVCALLWWQSFANAQMVMHQKQIYVGILVTLVVLALCLKKTKSRWYSIFSSMIKAVILLGVCKVYLFEFLFVPTGSMIPTVQPQSVILVNKTNEFLNSFIANYDSSHKRGDVVVFNYPLQLNVLFLKRIVGTPGDTLTYNFSTKELIVNSFKEPKIDSNISVLLKAGLPKNVKIYEHTLDSGHFYYTAQSLMRTVSKDELFNPVYFKNSCKKEKDILSCTIPPGAYFVMGDNRDNSYDSRFWGLVPKELVKGKVTYTLMGPELSLIGSLN